ncbi:MAG TPA: hypothetical protein VM802_29230 [Chitinophaga sp.]|uniref:hypothetical protein n=1 Tax=Chitinophaga sp. TaxID=1869181 RepID=UPI002C66013E|nr:hypothetical protein [Chitinophaga sp.]HVI48985.1 hypothetical protein [Chitinophaga sp.]
MQHSITLRNAMQVATMLLLAATVFTACSKSKDDNPGPGPSGHQLKVTITTTDLKPQEGDALSFLFVGSNLDGSTIDWKVDGQLKSNQTGITLEADVLSSGKQITVESAKSFAKAGIIINGGNRGTPYKFSYKVELDGKEVNNEQNITVSTNIFSRPHDYP